MRCYAMLCSQDAQQQWRKALEAASTLLPTPPPAQGARNKRVAQLTAQRDNSRVMRQVTLNYIPFN